MTLRNAFEGLATEDALEAALVLLSAILEKMPRVDVNDRMVVSHAESNPTVALASGQTLGTVTTVGTVSNVATMTQVGGRDAAHISYALANAGALHIYNNIEVSG